MRTIPSLLTIAFAVATSVSAHAADTLRERAIGTWKLTSNYDLFEDGTRRDTWGANPQGLIIFTREGLFSAILVGGDRQPKPGTVPTDPVGPAIAYYGTVTIDETAHTFTNTVLQSTFPQWRGVSLTRHVDELTDTRLAVTAAPITGPDGRKFVPHLEFERVK